LDGPPTGAALGESTFPLASIVQRAASYWWVEMALGVFWVLVSMAIGFSPVVATKFPTGGHHFSPLVAIESPHPWPSFLPSRELGSFQVRGFTPLPAVAWASR
jgi:hypothetical protein